MKSNITFKPYSSDSREICLRLFDANCPDFFAPNERDDYLRFLETVPEGYELCLIDDEVAGAFGLIGNDASRRRLNWIMLNPVFHGLGIGRAIMEWVSVRAASEGIQVVEIAASHKSASFFARFGAVTRKVTDNGWGLGMHRVDMELPLTPDTSLEQARGR
ncbi:MAG TPA: GNAT family N-acetyltransferase [Steroidobacteraceae bacterium]|nr:GNAT family N-acetyltransferase [Steroidobacteraceae bacterium]